MARRLGGLLVILILGLLLAPPAFPAATQLACVGDCNRNARVTVDELLTLVDSAIEDVTVLICPAGDANHDGKIRIDEILAAVKNALNGCAVLGAPAGRLYSGEKLRVGSHPNDAAIADLNGDGRPDIVTANYHSNDVSVILGTGDGNFGTAHNFMVGSAPFSVAIADLDGDGHLDVVTADIDSNTVSVLLGTGDGGLGAAHILSVGSSPFSVAVADLNGDGHPDVVTANPSSNDVRVLLGNGNGSFDMAHSFAVGSGTHSIAIADINGDGRPDVVAVKNGDADGVSVAVLLGVGDGSLGAVKPVEAHISAVAVAVGDVNGDGALDLVTVDGSYDARVLLGTGDGRFALAQTLDVGGTCPNSLAVADINDDGHPDIVTANSDDRYDNNVSVLLGVGTGTFAAARTFSVGGGSSSIQIADLNGDGRPDAVTVDPGADELTVLFGTGNGDFSVVRGYPAGHSVDDPPALAVADLNGDGFLDAITTNEGYCPDCQANSISVLFGAAAGSFGGAHMVGIGHSASTITAADLNGDGHLDIITANRDTNGVSVLLGASDGTLGGARDFAVGGCPTSLVVADIDFDGHSDIVTTTQQGSGHCHEPGDVSVLHGKGDGTFDGAYTVPIAAASVAVADLNGDGYPDMVTTNYKSNDASVLLGIGYGTFATAQSLATGSHRPLFLALADLDGDGRLDAVMVTDIGYSDQCNVSVLLGTGDGTFGPIRRFAVEGPCAGSVAVGDVNDDGRLDVAVANGSKVSVLRGIGDGDLDAARTFTVATTPSVGNGGSEAHAIVLADLNGDGQLDIVTANREEHDTVDVGVLLHQ